MNLATRERRLISTAVCALAIFLLLKLVIFPFFEARRRLERGIKVKEDALKQMVILSGAFKAREKAYQSLIQSLSKREKGFTLFSFLDRAAGQAKVKDHVKYMKPSNSEGAGPYRESMVEMKLENITLPQLVDYLHRIESGKNMIRIKRISIKENRKKSGYLDAVLQVVTLRQA